MSSGNTSQVLIVGGGVIGLSIARELRRLCAGDITIVERGRLGGEASHAAAGMLVPNAECENIDDFYRFCDESRLTYPALADELRYETGIDIELDRAGTFYAAFSSKDLSHLDERFELQKTEGIPVSRLSATETLHAEPSIASSVKGSLFFPNDWQVENRKLLAALIKFSVDSGINLIENVQVDSLIVEGNKVCGAVADRRRMLADVTVLATGAWTSFIKIAETAGPLDVRPIRGQMISYEPAARLFRHVIYSPRGYLVPRADGRVLIGATVENVGFDKSTTANALRQLSEAATEIAPSLAGERITGHWAGLRPFAGDGLPIVGPVPDLGGLLVATAHYRNGILLAPLTAKVIAEFISSGTTSRYFYLFGPNLQSDVGSKAIA